MKQVIINADDFGISPGINRGIIQCHREGIVRSASLMANLPAFENAVCLAKDNPGLGIGVHLNLTCGKPVAGPAPSLTSEDGRFFTLARLMTRLIPGRVNPREIRRELKAQIAKVMDAGLKPTHLDTHQHLHFYPLIHRIVQELAAEFDISWVRGSKRSLLVSLPWTPSHFLSPGAYASFGKMALLSSLRHFWKKNGNLRANETHCLSGLFTTAPHQYALALKDRLESLPEGVTEWVCHPGYVDEELKTLDDWTHMRETELKALTDAVTRQALLGSSEIAVTNFSALGPSTASEADFSTPAENITRCLMADAKAWGTQAKGLVTLPHLLEINAATLVYYYLRKALKLVHTRVEVFHSRRSILKTAAFNWAWFAREALLSFKRVFHSPALQPGGILFVTNVARQHASTAPVMKELLQCGIGPVTVVSKPPIPEAERAVGITYREWGNARRPAYFGRLLRHAFSLLKTWKIFLTETSACRGYPFLTGALETWFSGKRLQSLRAMLLADDVIASLKPSVIVVTDASDFEAKSFTLAGRLRGIPSLCLQYGMACEKDSEWKFLSQDYVGSFDSESAGLLRKMGIPGEKILLTGNPRFDSYRNDPVLRKKVRDALNVPETSVLIAFMSIPPPPEGIGRMESYITREEHARLLLAVYQIAQAKPGWILAVKPHPEEDIGAHRRLAGSDGSIRLISGHNSYDIINAADVVITSHSTTGLEAIYLDKPLVAVNLTEKTGFDDYESSGAAQGVRRSEELIPAIESLLSLTETARNRQEGRKRYRARNPYLGTPSGNSAHRCAEIIIALKEGKPPQAL